MAKGYLELSVNLEEKENYLRSACSAWNMACFESPKRYRLLRNYIEKFKEINNSSEGNCKNLEEDLMKLIEQKEKLYPNVMVRILDSKIEVIDGKEHVNIVSSAFI